MGREIRRVPKDWEHPKDKNGHYIPLMYGFNKSLQEWNEHKAQWDNGFRDDYKGGWRKLDPDDMDISFNDWFGVKPEKYEYMPEWDETELTHIMMYEDTSEGTPISPAFETPEELAAWLFSTNASAFGDMTASYEQWLSTCKEGRVPSMVIDSTGIH